MDYKKPQSTLVQGGVGLYPLTTADQVILADGSRLEKDGKISADSAADSAKLGGKAPEYYIQPRNLLDNSDFQNPVNQRGIASGNAITNAYCIDRWKLLNAGQLTFDDGYITISANQGYDVYFRQFFEKLPKFPVTVRLETTSGIITAPLAINVRYTFNDDMYVEIDGSGFLSLFIPQGKSLSIVNIALYEGSYTADTLPPYVPKRYAAELAECMRYYQNFQMLAGTGVQAAQRVFVVLPVVMRILPTIAYELISGAQPNNVFAQARNILDVTGADSYSHLSISLSADL